MKSERIRQCKALLKNERPKSTLETLAIERLIRDYETGHKRGLVWDERAAEKAVEFFGVLKHWKGKWAGQRFELEDWQRECIIMPLFGWKREDGWRRFREFLEELPRKTGKSTIAAGIGLYLLTVDKEAGAEIYSCATTRDQAHIIFDAAKRLSRPLGDRLTYYQRSIFNPKIDGVFMPVSSDYDKLDGRNPSGALLDELHKHSTRGIYDVMKSAQGARDQPMLCSVTTAGNNRQSICWEIHEIARQILEGRIEDDSFLCYITCADEKDDWQDPEVWWKANPNLGVSVDYDYIESECKRAADSPAYQNTFRNQQLNQWTQQESRWLDMNSWDRCAGNYNAESLEGRMCYGGLDLATTVDLAAFVLVFPPDGEGDPYRFLPWLWLPEENMVERSRVDRVPYEQWVREGVITATPGNYIDHNRIVADIVKLKERFNILEIAFDRWGAAAVQSHLQDAGLAMVQFGQGYASMSPAMSDLLRLVLNQGIVHPEHPVMNWMADNMVVTQDPAGNVKPDKSKSREKIDGMVALLMALGRAIVNSAEPKKIKYVGMYG